MKKQKVRRLTLHKETIKKLDDPSLAAAAGLLLSSQCSEICCPLDTGGCPATA